MRKWMSTASRAMNSRMISDEPSKIRLMRKSRIMRSTGTGLSPRARSQSRGLVAAAAADLQRVVDDPPAGFRVPHLGDRRLEPDVGSRRGRPSARPARPPPPWRRCSPPCARSSGRPRRACRSAGPTAPARWPIPRTTRRIAWPRGRARRQRQAAGVEGDERELEPLALAPQHVLPRHPHVREPDDAVLDRLEPHEVAAGAPPRRRASWPRR